MARRRSNFIDDITEMLVMLSQIHWGVGLIFTVVSAFSFFVLFPSFLPPPNPTPLITQMSSPITSMLLFVIKLMGILFTASFGLATLVSIFRKKI
jgi:hypothetical protein